MKKKELIKVSQLHSEVSKVIENSIDPQYLNWLKGKVVQCILSDQYRIMDDENLFIKDSLTPITRDLFDALYFSTTLCISAVEYMIKGFDKKIYVACRPPGHHASKKYGGGFCYFNNIGIATEYLLSKTGQYKRIAILDLDLHIGNGTIDYLANVPEAKYFSLHLNPSICYPFFDEVKQEELYSLNNNIFLAQFDKGTTEKEYLERLDLILEKISEYEPDAIFISMGYDTFKWDPCEGSFLEIDTYRVISKKICDLFEIPIVIFHEGGYNFQAAESCFLSFIDGME